MEKQAFAWEILSKKKRINKIITPCEDMRSIIELAIKGHFPLFYPEWLDQYKKTDYPLKSNSQTRGLTKKIMARLNGHKILERKRTILLSLKKDDLMTFINEFMKIVEGKILDNKPKIH